MIRVKLSLSALAAIAVLVLAPGPPVAAQVRFSFRHCRDMPIEILNGREAPVQLLDGTRLCRARGDFPAGEVRLLSARLLLENVSAQPVVAIGVTWVSHDENNPDRVRSRWIETDQNYTRPLKLRPHKRKTYEFMLAMRMPGHATHVTSIFVHEVEFADGSTWSTTLAEIREERQR